jgi:hypothetical protein
MGEGKAPRAMVLTDVRSQVPTILTYAHDGDRAVFEGVVDATNLEIFRDFLSLLPAAGDVVVSIAGLDLRIPQASMLLVDRARSLAPTGRLIVIA